MQGSTVFAFIISLLLQVGYPLAITMLYRRRSRAPWQLFAYGAFIFAVSQLFTWQPLRTYLDVVLGPASESGMAAFVWSVLLAGGTSLMEETGRWVGYRFLFPRGSFVLTWRNGVMYGLGHATLESALFIAGLTFVYLVAYIALGQLDLQAVMGMMDPEERARIWGDLQSIVNTSWQQPLTVALERIIALPHQIAWALLVMESLVYRQKRWFVLAVLYHASIAIIVPGVVRLADIYIAEGVNLLFAILSVWIILRLRALAEEGG